MPPSQHSVPWRPLIERTRDITTFLARLFENTAWPFVDLAIRFWLAKIFFISGMLKLMHWATAVELAAHEYPVAWLTPVTAATVGVSIETVAALILASGFMTRYAAIALGLLTLTIQLAYQALDTQLFWMALFGWYAIIGAGPLSVDHLLRRGLIDSALPLIPRVLRFSGWVRRRLGPVYLSLFRIWLALALALSGAGTHGTARSHWTLSALPLDIASHVPGVLALVGGALLLPGLGTRLLAMMIAVALFAAAMVDPRTTDAIYLLMSLVLVGSHGGGLISVDSLVAAFFDKHLPPERDASPDALRGLPRVVIVGAGFAGVSCATALRSTRVAVTLVDRANYHLFQPLLYQVATAALSPGDIAAPVRQLFRHSPNVRVLMGTLTGVDPMTRYVTVDSQTLPYDFLVLATGATHSYFGKDAWAPYAPGLKRIEDAQQIRGRILTAFERAEAAVDAEERAALLTFLIVGGGPTGVELAGAIAELARFGMEKEFRTFDPADAHVILVQSAPRLLPALPESLARIAHRSLEKLGVDVMLDSRVEMIDSMGVMVSGRRVIARTVLWAAGVAASPAARWLAVEADAAGRVKVGPNLEVPGLSNVFVAGDTAACNAWKGKPVPGLAPAAKQAGAHVAALIKARIEGTHEPPAFRYHHLGSLATIGRKAAVADFGFIRLWGTPAWWLWGLVHVAFLVGVRNRIATMVNWFWAYLTFGGGIRLITSAEASRNDPS
jgi:NADH dehydrogenase/putative oxidoreductase